MDSMLPSMRPLLIRVLRPVFLGCLAAALGLFALLAAVPALFGDAVGAGFASVDRNLCALASDGSAELLIGGDSRAKQQADPLILEAETGLKAVNVAEAITFGGDLPTLANALAHYPKALEARPMLLVSVSVTGHNDLAFEDLPAASVLNWSPLDHLGAALRAPGSYARYLFGWYLPFLKRHALHAWQGTGYACGDGAPFSPALLASRGYRPSAQTPPPPGPPRDAEDFHLDGGRRRAFASALEKIAATPVRAIYLYQAPMSPDWQADPSRRVDVEMERRFGELVSEDAARHHKVRFLDFFRAPPAGLSQVHFADNYHLNAEGAALFSKALADAIPDSLKPGPGIRTRP
jgi:hypothetical protein